MSIAVRSDRNSTIQPPIIKATDSETPSDAGIHPPEAPERGDDRREAPERRSTSHEDSSSHGRSRS